MNPSAMQAAPRGEGDAYSAPPLLAGLNRVHADIAEAACAVHEFIGEGRLG
jgi:hypothetical protein